MNNKFLAEMGKRIAERRKELNLTQEQVADKINVSLQTISCVELGKKAIRPENLANLCLALNISTDYILLGQRGEKQMNGITGKFSSLPPEDYRLVCSIIERLSSKKQ